MTKIAKNYKPSEKEKFMNAKMKEYFRLKLINWKKNLLKESSNTLNNLKKEADKTVLVCRNCHAEIHSGLHNEFINNLLNKMV